MGYEINPFTRKLDKVGAAGTGGGAVSVNFSAGSTSANLSAVTFANANNVSFGLNAGTITASVIPGAGGGIAASLSGNTAGALANISTGTMYLAGGNNITLSQNANSVTISGPNTVAQTQFVLSNSNGLSFGTNGSTVTASHNGITSQSIQTQNMVSVNNSTGAISLATGSSLSSSSNGSTITFGLASNITTALQSAGAYLTTAAQSNHSHGNPTLNLTNLSGTTASASNGLTLSLSANPAQTVQTQGMVSINGSTGAISLATGSSLSSSSNGSTITFGLASNITTALQSAGAYLTTAAVSNHSHAFSASGGSSNFQTLNFANSNGITFSNSNGSVIASHNGLTTAMASNRGSDFVQATAAFAGTNASGTIASNGISVSVNAGGVTPVASASNGSFSFTTLGFSNANNVTFGTSAGSIITASVAAPGAAAENNAIDLLGANTAGNTTATGSTIGWSGVNLTLSGTNASQIAISAPATSSLSATGNFSISSNGSTISMGVPEATATLWYPYNEGVNVMGQQGNATWHFAPVPTPLNKGDGIVSIDQAVFPMFVTNATNSTGTVTVSISMGLYTKTESSLSLAHSASGSFAVTFSGTVNNSTYAGIRLATIPFNTTFEGGRYYAGIAYRTTTGGANATVSQVLVSQLNSNFSGVYGSASNRSNQWPLGLGVRSASSSGFFSSIAFSQLDGTGSLIARPPSWHMRLGTA